MKKLYKTTGWRKILEKPEDVYWCIRRNVHNFYYYTKCAIFKRYNRLHLKTLPPTWVDRDTLLEHALFQILEDYINRESDAIQWDHDDEHKSIRAKMDELLEWWHEVYLKFDPYKDFDESQASETHCKKIEDENGTRYTWTCNAYENEWYKEVNRKEDEMRNELTIRLKEIIDLRGYLWS